MEQYLKQGLLTNQQALKLLDQYESHPILFPQPGPQTEFFFHDADIVFYGGAAGGGKTFGLMQIFAQYYQDPAWNGIIFRRTSPEIKDAGGPWDAACAVFSEIGGQAIDYRMMHRFPSGAAVKFNHLQLEKDLAKHKGGAYTAIGFDEVTSFTEKQFWYMTSRNRCGPGCQQKPIIRATTNPVSRQDETGGWVRELVDWWIDEDGFAIDERCGQVRHFARYGDTLTWSDNPIVENGQVISKSFTFIKSMLSDNRILCENDPGYEISLRNLFSLDRRQLLEGNWNVTLSGEMFKREHFKIIDSLPDGIKKKIRYWDRASTEVTKKNKDPDWTAGALCSLLDGNLYIIDIRHFRGSPATNEATIRATADSDGRSITVGIEQEPGSSGKDVTDHYQRRVLSGFTVMIDSPTGDKIVRAKPWAALAERGNVYLLRAPWNTAFINEACQFPHGKKDQIDAVSGAYKLLHGGSFYVCMI